MRRSSLTLSSTLFALLLTTHLVSDSHATSSPQATPSTTQSNIRHQLQPTSASAPVDKGWTLDASFLYWNAKADGFQFAEKIKIQGLIPNTLPTGLVAKGKLETPSFDNWDPGVQLGIGYVFPQREQWHTRLSWTRLHTDSHQSAQTPRDQAGQNTLVPTLIPFLVGTLADHAAAHWKLHFNTLDLELDRQFFVGKWLSFKPRIGLRGAWIEQNFRVKYHSLYMTGAGFFEFDNIFSCKQNFSGVGLRFGADVQFYITPSWSILGNLSSSLLWGSTKLNEKVTGRIFVSDTVSFPEMVMISKKIDKIRTALDGQLGIQWQTYCHQDKYRFAISALYSISYWFSQNQLTNQIINQAINIQQPGIVDSTTNGDLQMQGLNLQFEFDF